MLVITRRLIDGRDDEQRIMLNGNIILTLLSVDRNKVRFGIECPQSVRVQREERLDDVEILTIERAAREKT